MKPVAPALMLAPELAEIEADFWRELAAIEAEALGWIVLDEGAYFHAGAADVNVVNIVGVASASMADQHVLWLC